MFKGFIRYLREPDYHGRIFMVANNGTTTVREDCNDDNLRRIKEAVGRLRKLKGKHPSPEIETKIIVHTKYQAQFVGQCLFDRLWAKHESMHMFVQLNYSWDVLGSRKQKMFKSQMIRHEKSLANTFRLLLQILRLRNTTSARFRNSDEKDAMYVIASLRKMILWRGFSTVSAKLQMEELPVVSIRAREHYDRLQRSTIWNRLVQSLKVAEANVGMPNAIATVEHKKRMVCLLERSVNGI
jgi:hypothetical protein